ncbi:hypothetical protein DLJ49_00835 [Rhodovulum sp. 12E13]|uniref:hypothetical protein n=1 Tax=Rhodovulum sp. 12E13 TaxID=2203891 RepID=UPI000E174688|nr:hypothetical protein [Rhodovulum sp. 12E13]RDC75330.1 hypothetical protein DLJ49_00835 [Rhodovulum sp. 12E13]
MKRLLSVGAVAVLAPTLASGQESQLTDLDAGALYAMSSVAGARPNCSTLMATEAEAQGQNPDDRWLARDDSTGQWWLTRSDVEPGASEAVAVNSVENAMSLFIVCGIPARSDRDLSLLTDAIRDASSRWTQGGPTSPND